MKQQNKFKETEIGKIPEGWEIKRIGEVCHLVKDQYKPKSSENLPYIGLEHIQQGTLKLNSIGNSSDTISNKFRFKKGQILFGKLRPYFRKVYRPSFDGVCSTDIFVIDSEKGTANSFLFYFFANPKIIEEASRPAEGTRMPRASWNYLSNLNEQFPRETEQKAIAKILSDLDSKIELNQEMNQTLEAIAQAFFKYWFVDFEFPNEKGKPYKSEGGKMIDSELGEIPVGWHMAAMIDYFDFIKGVEPGHKQYNTENRGKRFFRVGNLTGKRNDQIYVDIPSSVYCSKSDVLMSFDGTVGIIRIGLEGVYSSGIQKIKPKGPLFEQFFTYLLVKSNIVQKQIESFIGNETTIKHVGKHIPDIKFVLPNEKNQEMIFRFNTNLQPIFNKILENLDEIGTLINIRDSLLPKLMSGQIRVPVEERT